jgi:hypothetical protein
MARVVIQAVVSVDGYIAYPDDTVGPLFDWYGNGDVSVHVNDKWPFHVSRASADYVQPFWDAIKVTVIGRHLFDTTDGWAGVPQHRRGRARRRHPPAAARGVARQIPRRTVPHGRLRRGRHHARQETRRGRSDLRDRRRRRRAGVLGRARRRGGDGRRPGGPG